MCETCEENEHSIEILTDFCKEPIWICERCWKTIKGWYLLYQILKDFRSCDICEKINYTEILKNQWNRDEHIIFCKKCLSIVKGWWFLWNIVRDLGE
jgi:hypothetical protein